MLDIGHPRFAIFYGRLEISTDWRAPFWGLLGLLPPPVLRQRVPEELAWVIREYGEDGDPVMADRIAEVVMMYVEKRHIWASQRGGDFT